MKVLKFGGTSVGSAENMKRVMDIVNDGKQKIVVLSAMSGTTNFLVDLYELTKHLDNGFSIRHKLDELHRIYIDVTTDLLSNEQLRNEALDFVHHIFGILHQQIDDEIKGLEGYILAQGEILSTHLFTFLLRENQIKAVCLPALEIMRIDTLGEPDEYFIKKSLSHYQDKYPADIYITQGFICRDFWGNITNLRRGGSDYTATILGGVVQAEEVQIWTDIDGFHNNDPRYVTDTKSIATLSFDEAAELAYFGAKILHPQTVFPAQKKNIPVYLKNTLDPSDQGTRISCNHTTEGIKAIAAKDDITAIKIKSERMLQSYGFLRRVFEIFERYQTPIDMITTSEVAVSVTIDNDQNLDQIVTEISQFAKVEIDANQSIVCLVGHAFTTSVSTYKLFEVLKNFQVRMISYGGSENNISLLVDTRQKKEILNYLHTLVF